MFLADVSQAMTAKGIENPQWVNMGQSSMDIMDKSTFPDRPVMDFNMSYSLVT